MTEQENQEQQNVESLSKELGDALGELLKVGDWESSLFLQNSASKLKALVKQAEDLAAGRSIAVTEEEMEGGSAAEPTDVPAGYLRVYVLLYQTDGNNLKTWYDTIKNLVAYSISRPAYREESHAEEIIRSKETGIDRNGYVIVNIKDDAFVKGEEQFDSLGHPLLALHEDAIKLENIVEFVHANKERYKIIDGKLSLLG